MKSYSISVLDGFPLVSPGEDIGKIIVDTSEKNGFKIQEGDVIVVAQKIFSKAEKRVMRLKDVVPSRRARKFAKLTGKNPRFVELVLKETQKMLKSSREVLLVQDQRGLICINAGIDKSNVEGRGNFALLPKDPDKSAQECRLKIKQLTGKNVAVVICDTYSRPFRRGQVNFAIGVAGIGLFRDYRGKEDLFGQVLKVKRVAVVDEIAAAAELLMGQGKEATPVAILRGLADFVELFENNSTGELTISSREDLFRGIL